MEIKRGQVLRNREIYSASNDDIILSLCKIFMKARLTKDNHLNVVKLSDELGYRGIVSQGFVKEFVEAANFKTIE